MVAQLIAGALVKPRCVALNHTQGQAFGNLRPRFQPVPIRIKKLHEMLALHAWFLTQYVP